MLILMIQSFSTEIIIIIANLLTVRTRKFAIVILILYCKKKSVRERIHLMSKRRLRKKNDRITEEHAPFLVLPNYSWLDEVAGFGLVPKAFYYSIVNIILSMYPSFQNLLLPQ